MRKILPSSHPEAVTHEACVQAKYIARSCGTISILVFLLGLYKECTSEDSYILIFIMGAAIFTSSLLLFLFSMRDQRLPYFWRFTFNLFMKKPEAQ